jgi:hypothetical protein
MTFEIDSFYLSKFYRFKVETEDKITFRITRLPSHHYDNFSKLPESFTLTKGQKFKAYAESENLIELKKDLLERIWQVIN